MTNAICYRNPTVEKCFIVLKLTNTIKFGSPTVVKYFIVFIINLTNTMFQGLIWMWNHD